MLTYRRSVPHELAPDRAREALAPAATRLGFTPDGELAFRRGTWGTHLWALDPTRVCAWLTVTLGEREATLELRVSSFLTILGPQDRRYYELELDALEAALHGREQDVDVRDAHREANLASRVVAVLVLALLAAGIAHANGFRWGF